MGITGGSVELDTRSLGERIVQAARLAVAVHLFESLPAASPNYGKHVSIGGAGPCAPATADRGHSRRPFRILGANAPLAGGDGGEATTR